MNKKLLAFAALALVTAGANAKVKLPHILGDNMIIQQDSEANLWGWDKPGTLVEVSTSWSQQKYSAKTGKDGKWAVKVQTPKASYTPLSITFDDGEKTTLNSLKMTKNPKFKWDFLYPLLWGNGTFHPILNYSVKGILFYQGCSNVGDPAGQYTQRLADLVAQWRRDFKQGELPFYFVQIAPYHNGDVNGDAGPRLREQQFNAAKVIPNSGIVCTEDLVYPYEVEQIHPCQKQPVGERLALQALSKTYGMKGLFCESMTFKEMKIIGDTVKVHFDNTYGAYNRFEGIKGFEVAGEDKVFHPATAKHFWQEGNDGWNECIVVTSPEVKKPVALRYCFRNFQLGNMANAGGLPLFPFRTDNW